LARGLLTEFESVSARLENVRLNLPDEAVAALKEAAEHAATSVRRGLESDIEGAGLKARAIVDAVYRAQSRAAMWMWIATGLVAATAIFGAGIMVGHFWWQ